MCRELATQRIRHGQDFYLVQCLAPQCIRCWGASMAFRIGKTKAPSINSLVWTAGTASGDRIVNM
jgi:hypothetical protein